MLVRFTKNDPAAPADTLTCVRPDGSSTQSEMPRQGILPHDVFHFVIEKSLGWYDGLFGRIARGGTRDEVVAQLHDPKAKRALVTQALHAEALAECLQTEQWGGPADPTEFAQKLIQECRRRAVSPPDITPEELGRVRIALREFGAAWRPLAPSTSLERRFST
jgi:hypothetical protein